MSQHGALTKQQAQYVAMVSQGQTHTDIAKAIGVDRRTLIRWHKLPQVQAAIAEANAAAQRGVAQQQQEQYKEIAKSAQLATTELVEKLLPAAVKTVAQILTDREAKDSDRLPWVTRDLGQFRRKYSFARATPSEKSEFSQHPSRQRMMISGERGDLRQRH